MSHSAPPTEGRYGPSQNPGLYAEGDGFTVVCACRWVRWWSRKTDATEGRLAHQKKCKKSEEVETVAPASTKPTNRPAPRPRSTRSDAWRDREEGSTWIDKL